MYIYARGRRKTESTICRAHNVLCKCARGRRYIMYYIHIYFSCRFENAACIYRQSARFEKVCDLGEPEARHENLYIERRARAVCACLFCNRFYIIGKRLYANYAPFLQISACVVHSCKVFFFVVVFNIGSRLEFQTYKLSSPRRNPRFLYVILYRAFIGK